MCTEYHTSLGAKGVMKLLSFEFLRFLIQAAKSYYLFSPCGVIQSLYRSTPYKHVTHCIISSREHYYTIISVVLVPNTVCTLYAPMPLNKSLFEAEGLPRV